MIPLLGALGITAILVESPLFAWLRRLAPLPFGCSMCMGMWVGMAMGAATSLDAGVTPERAVYVVASGGATSFVAYAADIVLSYFAAVTEVAASAVKKDA